MSDPQDQQPQQAPEGEPQSQDPKPADAPLGPNGESALRKERERANTLQAQLDEVAKAFGVKKTDSPDDLRTLISQTRRELAVERLARKHSITDEGDIEALLAVSDDAARDKLAARLAPKPPSSGDGGGVDEQPAKTWPRPKPDSTQGPKGAPLSPDLKPGRARLISGIEQALSAK